MRLIAFVFLTAAFSFIALNADMYFVPAAFPATLAVGAFALVMRTMWQMRGPRKPRQIAAWELWKEPPQQDMIPPSYDR